MTMFNVYKNKRLIATVKTINAALSITGFSFNQLCSVLENLYELNGYMVDFTDEYIMTGLINEILRDYGGYVPQTDIQIITDSSQSSVSNMVRKGVNKMRTGLCLRKRAGQ